MPCQSDYLEATGESQNVAKLIVYVYSVLGKNAPEWVKECAENYYVTPNGKQHRDKRLVPLLFSIMKDLDPKTLEKD